MQEFLLKHFYSSYSVLIILRVGLVCLPQYGYIHPDEFFQSVEVFAGKILELEHYQAHEFNSTFPLRSVAIPYSSVGLSIKLLQIVNFISKHFHSQTVLTATTLLIAPRLLICFLSFLVDYTLYRICSINNEKYKSKLLILASSYVLIVYGTRTFSNTIELILFSILLYYVCESVTFSNILNKNREYINYRYEKSKNVVERAKFHKLRLHLVSDSLRNGFVISTITVFGFFNRPTFLGYAVFPVFFWLYRGIGTKTNSLMQFHKRLLFFTLSSIPSFLFNILIDSFYFGYLTWGEIGMLDISLKNFLFVPLNFLEYNMNIDNLAEHGLHPKFLHIVVNVPILFNVLGVYGIFSTLQYFYYCLQRKYHYLPTVRSIKGLMFLSAISPVCFLSIFPHQEPRFLIPIVLPLVYLYGDKIFAEPDKIVIEAPKLAVKNNKHNIKMKRVSNQRYLLNIWILTNIVFVVFYGCIHQGGVVKAAGYLQQKLAKTPFSATEYHIVTSNVYSIPQSLFLEKSTSIVYNAPNKKTKYKTSKRMFLYEEGSQSVPFVLDRIRGIIDNNIHIRHKIKLYLLLPSNLNYDLMVNTTDFEFKLEQSFYPHLSTEAVPHLLHFCIDIFTTNTDDCVVLPLKDYFYTVFSIFSLNLYEIINEI